jgi:hypothetical protein
MRRDAAVPADTRLEGESGPVEPDMKVARSDPEGGGNHARVLTVEVDPPEDVGVCRTELGEETAGAGARVTAGVVRPFVRDFLEPFG